MIRAVNIHHHRWLMSIGILLMVTACSSAPQPKTVSGNDKEPINNAAISNELSVRVQEAQIAQLSETNTLKQPDKIPPKKIIIHFDYNSTKLTLSDFDQKNLMAQAGLASRIDIRGRTDGQQPTTANQKIALGRATVVRDYLITQGISPQKITINYLAVGDHLADNDREEGRAVNRRAEIELFFN